jgi:coproporphyrinogen III oxidase-like Fe-S oxidoreductase
VSLGVSAIGQTDDAYFQNNHDLPSWESAIDSGQLAITKGVNLTRDDRIRRWVIGQLICQFRLDWQQFSNEWGENLAGYFRDESGRLKSMIEDELVARALHFLKTVELLEATDGDVLFVSDSHFFPRLGALRGAFEDGEDE